MSALEIHDRVSSRLGIWYGNFRGMFDRKLFLSVFEFIFVAELPDKTALVSMVLATRHRALPVLLGAALALAVQSVVAVAAGGLFSLLPTKAVHLAAGLVFLVSAVFMWRRKEDDDKMREKVGGANASFWAALGAVFIAVLIAEWEI